MDSWYVLFKTQAWHATWINRQGSALAGREKLAVVSDSLQIADRARRIESKTVDADARLPRVDRFLVRERGASIELS
jgi:hypothetical protein